MGILERETDAGGCMEVDFKCFNGDKWGVFPPASIDKAETDIKAVF